MRPVLRCLPLCLAAAVLARPAAAAEGAPPAVQDGAHLFSPAAVAQAEEKIKQLRESYGMGLVVETVGALPEHERSRFRFWQRTRISRYLADWARKRAEAKGVDGVYVVVCNNPKAVVVAVWPPGRDKEFTEADGERLRRQVVHQLQKYGPDAALLNAVAEVRGVLQDYRTGASAPVSALWILGIILGVLAFWLVLGLTLRGLGSGQPGTAYAEIRSRGPLLPALLGSMFGAVAGYWIYDKLFLTGSRGAGAGPEPVFEKEPEPAPEEPEPAPQEVGDEHQR